MNTFSFNEKTLNNYSTYGDLATLQYPPVVDGSAQTASVCFGATTQPQECSGLTVPFTWGNAACVQPAGATNGFAIQNGIGYGQTVSMLSYSNGQAHTNNYGHAATIQPIAGVSGSAWAAATVTGATVQPLAVCRGETFSTPGYIVLGFARQDVAEGTLTTPQQFTILEFTRG